ncbi:hypothetical protein ACGFR8_25875 [Streptomyces brevispora]|uniref:hypothetical protein n=1 Tax=Streptomyces brevispora TaxID=887462 RepID=UPI003721E61A
MVPGFLTEAVGLLLGGKGRALRLRAVGRATVLLVPTVLVGSWAVLMAERHAGHTTITPYHRSRRRVVTESDHLPPDV